MPRPVEVKGVDNRTQEESTIVLLSGVVDKTVHQKLYDTVNPFELLLGVAEEILCVAKIRRLSKGLSSLVMRLEKDAGVRCRRCDAPSNEEISDSEVSDDEAFDAVPTGAPRRSVVPNHLREFYRMTKNLFSPTGRQKSENDFPELPENPHPGTEGVSFEEAIKQCPHLAEKYKDVKGVDGDSSGSGCPVGGDRNGDAKEATSKCPYKNGVASQEWPMRAVLMFIAYNIISTGVSIEAIKIAFIIGAYHMGLLHPAEFVTVYLATASMRSYKLLGLMLMLTNRGGPSFSYSKQYKPTSLTLLYSCLIATATIPVIGLSMRFAKWMEYFQQEIQTDTISFSIVDDLLMPLGTEFVFRGFLLNEMGKDLGSWFGVIGASGWFAMLKRGQASVKYAAFVQGVFWSLCTSFLGGNLMPVTISHIIVNLLRVFCPAFYFAVYPEGM